MRTVNGDKPGFFDDDVVETSLGRTLEMIKVKKKRSTKLKYKNRRINYPAIIFPLTNAINKILWFICKLKAYFQYYQYHFLLMTCIYSIFESIQKAIWEISFYYVYIHLKTTNLNNVNR